MHAVESKHEARPALVALDLSDPEFLRVAGLNALLEAQQLAAEGGTTMLLVGSPAPSVVRLLGLDATGNVPPEEQAAPVEHKGFGSAHLRWSHVVLDSEVFHTNAAPRPPLGERGSLSTA